MEDTWHAPRLDKSMWFLTNEIMTRGTNLLTKIYPFRERSSHTFPWTTYGQGGNWWCQKIVLQTRQRASSWSRVASCMKSSSWASLSVLKTYRMSFMKCLSWASNASLTLYSFGMDTMPLLRSWSKRSKFIAMNRFQRWLEKIRPNNTTPMAVMGITFGLLNIRRSY